MVWRHACVRQILYCAGGDFRYLGGYLTGNAAYQLQPRSVSTEQRKVRVIVDREDIKLTTIAVHHGPIPALAWCIELENRAITISGDMNGDYHILVKLVQGSDFLVSHHAVPEGASGVARNLHMPPSVIGKIANGARVGHGVLAH